MLRRALAFSYLEKYGTYVVGIISTAIISRLLGPADIGVFAVGMSVVGVVAVVRELGISTYLVQETDLSDERIRAAFTIMASTGLALALLVLALAWPAGRFYGDPRVTEILVVLAMGFALTPFGSVSQALLSRELRFGTLTWIRLLFACVTALVSAGLALAGWGPLSLAWGSVVAAMVNAIVSMVVRPHAMRPVWSVEALRRVFAVGGPATVVAVIEACESALPELLLGRMQSLSAAGLFSRAKGLSLMAHQMVARAAGPVFFSAFAEIQRLGQTPHALYERGTACVTAIGWTGLATVAVLADPIVAVLFGPAWAAVVPLLRWLCVAAAVALLTSGANLLLLAGGGAKDTMWAKLGSMPVLVASLAVGAWYGAEAMAACSVIAASVAAIFLCRAVKRRVGIGLRSQLLSIPQSLPIALAGGAGSAIGLLMPSGGTPQAFAAVVVGGLGCILASGLALFVSQHPLKAEAARMGQGISSRLRLGS